jgi:hypothetical protein
MLEKLKQYKFVEKSKSELEADRIVNDINNKLWNNNGYITIYNLGAVNQLKIIAQALDKYGRLERDDILKLISSYKESEGVSNLVTMILEEFDYKENQYEKE